MGNLHQVDPDQFAREEPAWLCVNFMLPLREPPTNTRFYRTTPDRWMVFLERAGLFAEQISEYGLRNITLLAEFPRSVRLPLLA